LENSCDDRRDRWHTFRRRDSFAKQKVRYAYVCITGTNAEFFRRRERARRNFIYRPSLKLSAAKPANSVNNPLRFECRIIARILRHRAKHHPLQKLT
jgi:hypothetical protein